MQGKQNHTNLHLFYYICVTFFENNGNPFGMTIPDRHYSSGEEYRFGFNGKENDKEYGAGGLTQDYGFRMYNPAIGKFLSVDPLFRSYPWYTPYQFAGNKPIVAIDLDGLEEYYTYDGQFIGKYGHLNQIRILPDKEVPEAIESFKKYNENPSQFIDNNTIGYFDFYLPSFSHETYSSEHESVRVFGDNYNPISVSDDIEYAVGVFSVKLQDKTEMVEKTLYENGEILTNLVERKKKVFIMSEVGKGKTTTDRHNVTERSTNIAFLRKGLGDAILEFIVHTHARGGSKFSERDYTWDGQPKGDKRIAETYGVPIYLIDKKGIFYRFDPNLARDYDDDYATTVEGNGIKTKVGKDEGVN